MNALVLAITYGLDVLGKCQSTMQTVGLLWVGNEFAQPVRAASKVVGMVDNQWRKLFFGSVGGSLEQSRFVGWGGG